MMQRFLDTVEQVGNRVPHPVIIFLILIGFVIVLSFILEATGASVTYQVINPETHAIETATTQARSLATASGIRDIYVRLVPNFMGFAAIGLLVVAMVGVGVAEEAGLIKALIRMIVAVAPAWSITYLLAFVGVLSSIAADAGYVVLIPLAGAAFLSLGRHPLAGIALGFAAVAGAFNVNMLIKPLDAVLTELTNDAIRMVDPTRTIELTSGLLFSIVSVPLLVIVIALVTDRVISPRLGKFDPSHAEGTEPAAQGSSLAAAEWRGLAFAAVALVLVLGIFGLLTLPSGAPLRNPETGALIGNSPFMNGLIVAIMFVFLAAGVAYGIGAATMKSSADVIGAMTKAISGLGGTHPAVFGHQPVHRLFQLQQPADADGGDDGRRPQSREYRLDLDAPGVHPRGHRVEHCVHARDRQVGDLRAGLRAALRDPECGPRGRVVGVSRRRLADQHADAAQCLFRAGRRVCTEVRQKHRHRHCGGAAPALRGVDDRCVDGSVCRLVPARSAVGLLAPAGITKT